MRRVVPTDVQLDHWRWLHDVDDAVVARFLTKYAKADPPSFIDPFDGPCLLWTGGTSTGGQEGWEKIPYGSFWVSKRNTVRAHIFSALVFGTWDSTPHAPGYHVDHRCRRSLCVAPGHLESVVPEENAKRSNR